MMSHRGGGLFLLLALTMGIACGTGVSFSASPPPGPIPQTLADLVRGASLIIVVEVVDIRPGRVAGPAEDRLQFKDVRVRLEKRLMGDPPATVVVEQVAMKGNAFVSEVGPPYKRGERYVLFLSPGEGARYITAFQGRYLLKARRVRQTQPGLVADKLEGMSEAKLVQEIEAIVKGQR